MNVVKRSTQKNLTQPILRQLAAYESRNVTFLSSDGSWPIVWEKARGMHVWDVEGRRYLDLTAAFGVAACGHAPREVVQAATRQMQTLLHAMGDVHPHRGKADLARALSRWTFERWSRQKAHLHEGPLKGRVLFSNSGFEAVEAALKTSHLATGKPEVIAFKGAYHGLGYGALSVTHRRHFRGRFLGQLKQFGHFVDFPEEAGEAPAILETIGRRLHHGKVGAILMEPIQSRAGLRIPPAGFMASLRDLCDAHGACLVLDEIYTGFGRTGTWFACEHEKVIPDLICLGKALTGGFPLSACVGRSTLMDHAWPPSTGEAIHTSTYLGHPVGCAMALAQLKQLKALKLSQLARVKGQQWIQQLSEALEPCRDRVRIRGRGLMLGIEVRDARGLPDPGMVLCWTKTLLDAGVLVLPEGDHGEVLGISPPLIISDSEMQRATRILRRTLRAILAS